jgi:hypothetical protein
LQTAWFKVRGIPYDKRSMETAAYVGSLVGATMKVDKSYLSRVDYVRVKIAAKDVAKIPQFVEGQSYLIYMTISMKGGWSKEMLG